VQLGELLGLCCVLKGLGWARLVDIEVCAARQLTTRSVVERELFAFTHTVCTSCRSIRIIHAVPADGSSLCHDQINHSAHSVADSPFRSSAGPEHELERSFGERLSSGSNSDQRVDLLYRGSNERRLAFMIESARHAPCPSSRELLPMIASNNKMISAIYA
jgi:hypothetical protein